MPHKSYTFLYYQRSDSCFMRLITLYKSSSNSSSRCCLGLPLSKGGLQLQYVYILHPILCSCRSKWYINAIFAIFVDQFGNWDATAHKTRITSCLNSQQRKAADYLDADRNKEGDEKKKTHGEKVRITVESDRHRYVANLTFYWPASSPSPSSIDWLID